MDCSAFVYTTFESRLGLILPRVTKIQARVGDYVDRDDLRPGDLVFFETGYHQQHVGIYINDERFLHVSSSHGVIISNLEDPYWAAHYWQARRVSGE